MLEVGSMESEFSIAYKLAYGLSGNFCGTMKFDDSSVASIFSWLFLFTLSGEEF